MQKKDTGIKRISKVSRCFAGCVLDAEREYVEAVIFYVYEMNGIIEPLKNLMFIPQAFKALEMQ